MKPDLTSDADRFLALILLTGDGVGAMRRSPSRQSLESPEGTRAFAEQRQELAELLGLSDTSDRTSKPAWPPPQTRIRTTDERVPDSAPSHTGISAGETMRIRQRRESLPNETGGAGGTADREMPQGRTQREHGAPIAFGTFPVE
ncbi:MAG: hypothetical protein KA191_03605 [Verrucomicrobia bacterium]|jgi:hypothetical protein|nr:hypothetical protein [Verrucomicrobiota bacterium]OQC65587.1 MAG: hypothetical protein BWX48_02337 [Verrucomicrobia bacterium ADurb.Bin006]MDI9380517.1 hypothetical protein [Verrucomicrobiota bacterium]NMD22145.1 hypothetical protein [Verrucomicrobiota bacterium]HNU99839.1 hypothetical protein [Verrucomicrobiota bacterium]